jgi:hypothetical protein
VETLEVERSVRGVPRVWLPDAGIAVSLRDVWMRHRDDRPDQLVGVTVDLPRRGLTAVVGPSGGERQRIAKVARTTSVVVVAHRLSTVVAADRILVMECGRLRAAGTHAELVAADDRYRTLAVTQLLGDETDSSAPTGRHAFVPGSRALKVDCKAAQDGYRLEIATGGDSSRSPGNGVAEPES